METRCVVCNRRLKNPKWVALGVGPGCAKKLGLRITRENTLPYAMVTTVDGKFRGADRFVEERYREQHSLLTLGIDPIRQPTVAEEVVAKLTTRREYTTSVWQALTNHETKTRVAWIDIAATKR